MVTRNKEKKKSEIKDKKKVRKITDTILKNYLSALSLCKSETELLKKTTTYLLKSTNSSAGIVFKADKRGNLFKSLGILFGRRWIKCNCNIDTDLHKKGRKSINIKKIDLRKNLIKSKCSDINLLSKHKFSSTYAIKDEKENISAIVEILRDDKSYDADELKNSEALIRHCERVLKNIERSRAFEEYSDKLKTVSDVIHIINDSHNLNDMAEKITHVMHRAVPYDALVFSTYDDSENYIVDLYIAYNGEMMKRNNLYSPTSIGDMKATLKRNKALIIDDIKNNPFGLARTATIGEGMSSEMIIGCISKGKIIGVLVLVKKEKNFYRDNDEWFMKMIAKDISSAMIRFRADETFRKQNLYSKLCNTVTKKTLKSPDPDSAVKNLFAETEKILPFDTLKLGLFNKDFSKLTIYLQPGNSEKLIVPKDYFDKNKHEKVIKILSSKKRYLSIDSHPGKSFFDETIPREKKLLSAIIFPLALPSRIIGFISLLSKNQNIFDNTDLKGFASIAENFSIALDNLILKNESIIEKTNWETTFDSISDYILIVDRVGSISRLNAKAKRFMKKTGKKGRKDLSLNSFLNLLQIPYAENLKEFAFDENQPVKTVVQSEDGDKSYNILIDPVREKGTLKCEEAIFQIKDLTDIKKTESALKATNKKHKIQSRKFKALSKIAEIINRAKPPQEIFEKTGIEINNIIPFESGKIWVFDQPSEDLESIYTLAVHTEKFSVNNAMKVGLKNSSVMRVIKDGKPLIRNIDNKRQKYREDKFIKNANIRSVLYIPLESKNKITGCLSIGAKRKTAFDEDDIDFMAYVAGYLSSYLENIKLLSELSQANIEWERTFNSTLDYIFITDDENNIIKCNESFKKDYLESEKGLPVKKCYEIFCKNKIDEDKCNHRAEASSGKVSTFECNDVSANRTFITSISPIGSFSVDKECYVHIATDITDIRNAEETISKQAAQLNTMFENSPDGMILFDAEENVIKTSNSVQESIKSSYDNTTKTKRIDFFKDGVMRMLLPDGTPIPYEDLPSTKAFRYGLTTKNFESIVEYKDGKRMHILENVIPLRSSENKLEGVVTIYKDMTQLKESEEKLFKQSKEINTVFENSPDGMIFMDKEQKIVKFSKSAAKILDVDLDNENWSTRTNFLNEKIARVTKSDGTPIHFEDLPITRAYRDGKTVKNEEIVFEYKNGRKKYLLIHILPLKSKKNEIEGVVSFFKDITKSKKDEIKLRNQAEELNNIFFSFHDSLILIDDKGKVLKKNDATHKLFDIGRKSKDFTKDVFLKRYLFFDLQGKIIPFNERPLYLALKKGISTKNMEATLMIDGKIKKAVLLNAIPFKDEKGNTYSALGVYSDITDKKILESKLLQGEKLSSLGTMVAGIAHELNNPLSGIVGFSELLLDENLDEKQMEKMRVINTQADRASSIVKDLMIFSKQKEEDKKPANINNLLEQSIKMVSYGFKNHQINMEKILEPSLPIIDVHINRIFQVFINILKNSYQNMTENNPSGIIRIKTSLVERRPTIKIKGDSTRVIKIIFEDEGTGIKQSVINKIFDPFFSLNEATDSIGLGLAITYSIIKEHNGDIIVTSEEGKGTRTNIYLPVPDSAEASGDLEKPSVFKKDGIVMPTAGIILILSNDENLCEMISAFKARHMIEPSFVKTGIEALKKTSKEYFHLIICDIDNREIEVINFYKKAIKIKKDLSDKFLFTGKGNLTGEFKKFINFSGCNYLKKPLSRTDLRTMFHSIVDISSLQ